LLQVFGPAHPRHGASEVVRRALRHDEVVGQAVVAEHLGAGVSRAAEVWIVGVDEREGRLQIEVSDVVRSLGIELPYAHYKWYGEAPDSVRDEFFHQARLLDLDGYTSPESSENLSTRLWRRYGAEALGLLENIREDPRQAEVLIRGTEYLRCEVAQAARREMITKLEDFLRRRSKIALVVRREDIRASPGLAEACEMLFGEQATEKLAEYFASPVRPLAASGSA